MHGDPQAVALSARSVSGSPIVVVGADGRYEPGSLLQHLRDCSVIQIEAVFDGIASAIEGAVQADAAVSVAGNFLSPAVSFIDDGAELFNGQRGLRNQFAIFAYPRTVRHVDLDPVCAMV